MSEFDCVRDDFEMLYVVYFCCEKGWLHLVFVCVCEREGCGRVCYCVRSGGLSVLSMVFMC